MRKLGIDYGEKRIGIAITDELNLTAQGLQTIAYDGNDKIFLKSLDEILQQYDNNIDTIVVGMPFNMSGNKSIRAEKTEEFIHKLKCKYNNIQIVSVDERLTTVQAYKTMNELRINKRRKKSLVDTLSAVYILETYINRKSK